MVQLLEEVALEKVGSPSVLALSSKNRVPKQRSLQLRVMQTNL
jgi:hypothetical protein